MMNRDIIIVGQQAWDIEIGSNCKNIAIELSKNNRVLYVNPSLDRITRVRYRKDEKVRKRLEVIQGRKLGLEQVGDNLWTLFPDELIESINWIRINAIYTALNKVNNKRLARAVFRAIELLGFQDYILFNDGDMFRSYYLDELIHPALSIYYSRDYLLATDYYKFHGAILEPLLIKKSTLCVSNSTYLKDYCKKYNPHSFYIGQGCEPLSSSKTPQDIANIEGTIVGYVGALLSARLDILTLMLIARDNPDWQIVLVGPEDEEFKSSGLHALKNVHFLGAKQPGDLGDYINAFDICLNPQILNELTIGNYPRKIDEYLLMGKPVVATATKAMEVFQDYVYLAHSGDEYPGLVSKAIKENNLELNEARQAFARSHTWEESVSGIYKAIETVQAQL